MSADRSSRPLIPLRVSLVLTALGLVLAVAVGSWALGGGSTPVEARTTPTTVRRSTATTVRSTPSTKAPAAKTPTAKTPSTKATSSRTPTTKAPVTTSTTTVATTTASPSAGSDQQAAGTPTGPPALLVSGPEVAVAASRADVLLSPTALWTAIAAFAVVGLLVGAATARYWRRTRPV